MNKKDYPFQTRLDAEMSDALDALSTRTRVSKAEIVRQGIAYMLRINEMEEPDELRSTSIRSPDAK